MLKKLGSVMLQQINNKIGQARDSIKQKHVLKRNLTRQKTLMNQGLADHMRTQKADTQGGREALEVLLKAYQKEDADYLESTMSHRVARKRELEKMPQLKNFVKSFSYGTVAGKSQLDKERYKAFGLKKENQDSFII